MAFLACIFHSACGVAGSLSHFLTTKFISLKNEIYFGKQS